VEIGIHILLFLSPLLLLPVLVLLLRFKGLLELGDSIDELILVRSVGLIILLDTDSNFGNGLLHLNSDIFLFLEHLSGV